MMTRTLEFPPELQSRLQVLAAGLPQMEKDATPVIFSRDRQTRNAQIRALLYAPEAVRRATLAKGKASLADDYANDPTLTEFTRALQNEDFHAAALCVGFSLTVSDELNNAQSTDDN